MSQKGFLYRIFLIPVISILFTANSCSNGSGENLVYIAEKLIDSKPDSALLLLESIDFPENMPAEKYAGYCRLLVMAHQKNKIAIRDDTLIHNAVDYYKNIAAKKTEYIKSLHLLGNVYEGQDSILRAEQCYLEVFELSKQINDPEIYGVSAFELGGLHKYLGNYDKSTGWFNVAAKAFEKNGDHVMKRRSMRQTADCYVLSGNTDTALIIYNNVLSRIPPQKENVKADVYKNMAIACKNAKYYDESLYFIKKSIRTTTNKTLYPVQYMILASIYENTGKQDSALYYNRLALKYAKEQKNLSMLHKAYEALFEINYPQSFDNYILSKSLSDSIYQKQKYESLRVKYQKLYDIERIKEKNKDLVIRLQRYTFLSLLILLGSVLFYLHQRNSKKKKQRRFEEEIEHKNNIIYSIRNSLYQRLVIYKKMVRLSISPNKARHKTFLKEYNKILFDSDNDNEFVIDWNVIYDLCNNIFDNYSLRIKNIYPEINDPEEKIIILLKLGFQPPEIASILEKSIHTVYRYCSNIRKKLAIPEYESIMDFIDNFPKQ
jgi:hypothetical protein